MKHKKPRKKNPDADVDSDTIDWGGIKVAAQTLGLREAARQATRFMEEPFRTRVMGRILKKAVRDRWMKEKEEALAANPMPVTPQEAKTITTGADAVLNAMVENKKKSEAAIAKAITRKAEFLADILDPADIPAVDLNHITTAHNKLFNAEQDGMKVVTPIQINIG